MYKTFMKFETCMYSMYADKHYSTKDKMKRNWKHFVSQTKIREYKKN